MATKEKETQLDRVSYSFGMKVNVGNYESKDFHVSYSTDVAGNESVVEAQTRARTVVEGEVKGIYESLTQDKAQVKATPTKAVIEPKRGPVPPNGNGAPKPGITNKEPTSPGIRTPVTIGLGHNTTQVKQGNGTASSSPTRETITKAFKILEGKGLETVTTFKTKFLRGGKLSELEEGFIPMVLKQISNTYPQIGELQ